jgi:hypothetical protein
MAQFTARESSGVKKMLKNPMTKSARKTSSRQIAAKDKPARPPKPQPRKAVQAVLLSGGNPQIAKACGNEPVQAYIAAMPGWKSALGRRIDTLITRTVPHVYKAVKWNSPFYGIENDGWFLNIHCFTNYIKVAFFRGASLDPVPPGKSKMKDVRYLDIREDDEFDEALFVRWITQASRLPGYKMYKGELNVCSEFSFSGHR